MIYSSAFKNLPARVKLAVLNKMHVALKEENSSVDWIKQSEKVKISQILQ
jgi:hypothetical protein